MTKDGDERVSIESQNPPRPDDTQRHRLARDERLSLVRAAARKVSAMRLERVSEDMIVAPPTPAFPVPDAVFGDVVEATPDAREVVLILDDDDQWRGIWRRALARDGVELYLASRLAEAISLIEQLRSLSVAVLDWQLPNGDGVYAAEAIAMKFPAAKIIVCSGYDSEERPNEAMRSRFRAAAPACIFRPKQVADQAVRQGLKTPHGGMPPVRG